MNGIEEPKEDLTRRKEGSTTAVQFSGHLTRERRTSLADKELHADTQRMDTPPIDTPPWFVCSLRCVVVSSGHHGSRPCVGS